MDDISFWRKKIDEIDEEVLKLINRRAEYVLNIGKIKAERNMTIHDPDREKRVIENVCQINKGPFSDDSIRRVFELIIEESKRLEGQAGA